IECRGGTRPAATDDPSRLGGGGGARGAGGSGHGLARGTRRSRQASPRGTGRLRRLVPIDRVPTACGAGGGSDPWPLRRPVSRRAPDRGGRLADGRGHPSWRGVVGGQGRLHPGSGHKGEGRNGASARRASAVRRRDRGPIVQRPWDRPVDGGDVPDLPTAPAGRLAGG